MKFMEYIYLAVAIGLSLFLVQGFSGFGLSQKVMIIFSIAITAFMYSFRRKQRLVLEKRDKEEVDQIKQEVEEEDKQDA